MAKVLTWLDVYDIALYLEQTHAHIDPLRLQFTELRALVMHMPFFDADKYQCNEKILEAIQMAWLDEKN